MEAGIETKDNAGYMRRKSEMWGRRWIERGMMRRRKRKESEMARRRRRRGKKKDK